MVPNQFFRGGIEQIANSLSFTSFLKAGDLLMLEDVVDEAWYRGHSVRTGQVGIFPMNHVEVKIPLSSGLYLDSQPKPKIRTSLDPNEERKTPITQSNISVSNAEIEEHEKVHQPYDR